MPARIAYTAQHIVSVVGATGGEIVAASVPTLEAPGAGSTFVKATPPVISITEAINLPLIDPTKPPIIPPNVPPNDALESLAGPMISLIDISIPSSWSVPATGKSESLSGIGSAPNNTSAGSYEIFPNVNLVVTGPVGGPAVQGVGSSTTTATITGAIPELNSWVVPWTPTDSIPNFDGSDYARVKSEGYGRSVGAFIITFKLKFDLAPPLANHASAVEAEYTIKVLNNFDNDKEQYKSDYADAYAALETVPDPSTWQ
jgi:hypothetical protein